MNLYQYLNWDWRIDIALYFLMFDVNPLLENAAFKCRRRLLFEDARGMEDTRGGASFGSSTECNGTIAELVTWRGSTAAMTFSCH